MSIPDEEEYSTIPHEHLKGCEKFRFRRVCIISGANASGKTALGKILCNIQNLWERYDSQVKLKTLSDILETISDKSKAGKIEVEFVTSLKDKYYLNSFQMEIKPNKGIFDIISNSGLSSKIEIKIDDNINSAREKLKNQKKEKNYFKLVTLPRAEEKRSWWFYVLSRNSDNNILSELMNKEILEKILLDMDSSIKNVENIKNDEFRIIFNNGDTLLFDRKGITDKDRLSAGTYDSLSIAILLSVIIKHKKEDDKNKKTTHIYFLDEKMSRVHSELEISILNLMINKLPHNAQLFYTTHNYDVVSDMNLPLYSYLFMGKENGKTVIVQPEQDKIMKKNKEKLLEFLKNDFFSILPSTKGIDELLFDEDNNDLFGE
ncbi:MAG: ATP-binding protein [Neisseriaceae bacterium]|nr:ATP-binding protein [Neisseriaceae bacterium]